MGGGRPHWGLPLCSTQEAFADKQGKEEEEMATGGITTLPSTPEDGGSGGFPPGSFKDPKRLYCKNGGFFLRIRSDGVVDGIREKTDPHSKRSQSPPRLQCSFMLLSECNREAKNMEER